MLEFCGTDVWSAGDNRTGATGTGGGKSNVAKTVCSVTAGGTPPQGITWPVTPSVCVPTLETFKSVTVSSTTGSTPLPTQPENDCAIPRKPLSDKPVVAACGTICVNSYCGASAKSTSRFRLVMAGIEPP